MQAEKSYKPKPRRRTKIRILKLVLALIGILILLAVFLIPAFVSSAKGRETILAKINDSIDGETDFATLSMSWFKGVKVTDFSFNDRAGQILVAVRQIVTKPHYGSILMGSLSLGETIIDEPRVKINLKGEEAKKAEVPQKERATEKRTHAIALPIKKIDLIINSGNLKVTGRGARTVEVSQINSRVNLRPPGQRTNFDIDIAVADDGKESKISAEGQVTPKRKTGWSLKGTSGAFAIEVNDLNIEHLGPIFALAGVDFEAKGRISANIKSKIENGKIKNLKGTVRGRNLDITGSQLKPDRLKSKVLDATIELKSDKKSIDISKLEIQTDWLNARASGDVPTTFKSVAEFVSADSKHNLKGDFECDLAAVLSQMPRTFGLKEGMAVTSGKLSGDIETLVKDGQRRITGQANLVGLAGSVDGKAIALSEPISAAVEITSEKSGIKYGRLALSAAFAKISCSGTNELLKYEVDANLERLQSDLGQFIDTGRYKVAGELFSKGTISGRKDEIAVAGSCEIKDLRLSSTGRVSAFEPMANVSFSVIAEPDKSIVNVDFIKANASIGEVSIEDAVLPLNKKATKSMRLAVSAKKIDLARIQPFMVLFASFPKEMQLAGTAESQIEVSSKKGSYRIITDATHIKNLKVSYPEQKPFEQSEVSIIFDAEVNPAEKTIAVRRLQLISPQIKIKKGEFNQTTKGGQRRLQGKAELEYDWSAVSTMAGPFLPMGLRLEGQREDTISFAAQYPAGQTDKIPANLDMKARLGFERGHYMGLHFGPTEVDIQIRNGFLRIAPFSTSVNNGQFNFAGGVDFKQEPILLKTPGPIQIAKDIQINDETTKKLLMYVNPIFANTLNVSGVANFNCERLAIPVSGATKDDIEVIGTVSIEKIRLQQSDLLGQILSLAGTGTRGRVIRIHPTRFALQDGFLRYDDMQMDIGDHPVVFGGVIGLDKSLNMTITLPYTTMGRTARVGEKEVGKRIVLPLKGTIDKPELDLGKLLEEQLKQQLEQKIREGLEGLFK